MRRWSVKRAGIALLLAGILAIGFNLRAAITSLPPLFPELHHALQISTGNLAVLAAIPVICFGVFSGSAAPLSRRFGEERVLGAALLLLCLGLLLRGLAPHDLLFPGTVLAGAAIALMNVLLPSLVKRRKPDQAGLLIGLYLLALSAGAILASLLAVPIFTAAGAGTAAVRLSVGIWAAPALLAAAIWAPQLGRKTMPDAGQPRPPAPSGLGAVALEGVQGGRPPRATLRRNALAWQVTAFMGLQSLSYYAALSWFPTLFRDQGVSAAHAGDLSALMNLGNAVTALLIPVLAHRVSDQRLIAAGSVLVTAGGLAGAAFGPLALAAPFIFFLGLGQGATLGLAIFYTMARAPDPVTSASLSGFAQGIGYLIAATGPLLIGFLHTATGGWVVPIWTLEFVAVLQLAAGWLAGRARLVPALG
jgi:MFS transporter, CP family, cyanate transporter